jgi:hypothetical protein
MMIVGLLLAAQAATPVLAEPKLLEVESRFAVVEPHEGGSRTILTGEMILEIPMRWRQGATLAGPVSRQFGKRSFAVAAGDVMARTQVAYPQAGFEQAMTFCLPRATYVGNPLSRAVWRSTTDGQFCVIDRDNDGSIDHSMLLNTGEPAERQPQPLAAIRYTLEAGPKVGPGDRFKVHFNGGANFQLSMEQGGTEQPFAFFRYEDARGRHGFASTIKGRKQPDGTFLVELPGRSFVLSEVDKTARTARISWQPVTETSVIPVPDEVL